MSRRFRFARAIPAVAVLLAAACGSIGEPLPPLLNIPGQVEDLAATQAQSSVFLRWTWPPFTTEGVVLREVERFAVHALDIPADSDGPPADAFEALSRPVAEVAGAELARSAPGGPLGVQVPVADRFGQRTAFAVRAISPRGKTAAWSNYVIVEVRPPPATPERPLAEAVPDGVRLTWAPVERASGYTVFRRRGEEPPLPLGETEAPEYLDASAPEETPLGYRVAARAGEGLSATRSGLSEEAALIVVDVFPPAAPTGLRAVFTGETVELTWTPNSEPDLAGYRVLRDGEPIHQGLLDRPAFSDAGPSRGARAEYRVEAHDRRGNRSPASEPAAVTVP